MITKMPPAADVMVKASPRNIAEIAIATNISVRRTTEEVTGEIYFNPSSHK
jgi:hypothetical protein